MSNFRTVSDRFDIEDFGPQNVHILDIATGLAKANRYNGQYVGDHMCSVAQHSVHVSLMMEQELIGADAYNLKMALIGLLHDASEAYLGDCPKPFKNLLPDFEAVEDRFQSACYIRLFGRDITDEEHDILKIYDQRVLDMECRELGRPTCYDLVDDERFADEIPGGFYWWDISESRLNFNDRYRYLFGSIRELWEAA